MGEISSLERTLMLERLDEDTFSIAAGTGTSGRVRERLFGGQVAAQSLRAACHTVEEGRLPHSLHSYFLRAGRHGEPVTFKVSRTRDGRSFSSRHVTASQEGKPIFELLASFHDSAPGQDWPPPARPDVPGPEGLSQPALPGFLERASVFDIRLVNQPTEDGFPMPHPFWVKVAEPLGDDFGLHACLLTYLSDMAVVSSSRAPGSTASILASVSLDHSLWFHRPARVDEWMLYSVEPVTNHGSRGLARGSLVSRDGVLIASMAQEALLRPHPA